MMGKASTRKKAARLGAAASVHDRIAAEAEAVRNKDRLAFQPAELTPALSSLLDSVAAALSKAVPATFEHEGRPYYLRVSFDLVRVMVFETATAPEPMAFAITGSEEEFGHLPYH
jgi:hypothetical protein